MYDLRKLSLLFILCILKSDCSETINLILLLKKHAIKTSIFVLSPNEIITSGLLCIKEVLKYLNFFICFKNSKFILNSLKRT